MAKSDLEAVFLFNLSKQNSDEEGDEYDFEDDDFIDDLEALTGTPADFLNAYATLVESAGVVAGVDATESEFISDRSVAGIPQESVEKAAGSRKASSQEAT